MAGRKPATAEGIASLVRAIGIAWDDTRAFRPSVAGLRLQPAYRLQSRAGARLRSRERRPGTALPPAHRRRAVESGSNAGRFRRDSAPAPAA
jgi:hypothetical protein